MQTDVPPSERDDNEESDDREKSDDVKTLGEWDVFYRDKYNVRLVMPKHWLPVDWDEEMTEKEFLEGLDPSSTNFPGEDVDSLKAYMRKEYPGPYDYSDLDLD